MSNNSPYNIASAVPGSATWTNSSATWTTLSTSPQYGNVTITTTGTGGGGVSVGPPGYIPTNNHTLGNGMNTDIFVHGRSLKEFMEKVEERLSILVPDLEKLEHFQALKEAHDHYKTLEAMCTVPKKDVKK